MKKLFFVLLLAVASVNAKEVVSQGRGATSSEALQNAKIAAVERVAGAFVVSETRVNGDELKRQIINYSGGMIRKYEVLDEDFKDGVYYVVINADVDDSKINNRIVSSSTYVSEDVKHQIEKSKDDFEKTHKAIAAMSVAGRAFAAYPTHIDFINYNEKTVVNVSYVVKLQPKWYDDMYTLAKAIGLPTDVKDTKAMYVMCFSDAKYTTPSVTNCYDVRSALVGKMSPTVHIELEGLLTENIRVNDTTTMLSPFGPPHWTWMDCGIIAGGSCKPKVAGVLLKQHGYVQGRHQFVIPTSDVDKIKTINVKVD